MRSITHRWLVNGLSVIVVVLIVIDVVFSLSISSYYYYSARQLLESKASVASSLVIRLMDDPDADVNAEIRNIVETFSDSDKMEIIALNHAGQAVITSSGFNYINDLEMPDYTEAVASQSGNGYYVGEMRSGEKVMAVTVLLPVLGSEFNAFRLMISLQQVDHQLFVTVLVFTAFCLLILFFVIISGLYFVKSIVVPVRDVGAASRKIASGDLEVRIERKSDDEIGELSDTINYMADELQKSNQVKNDFISSVSHELRTPLTAIKGWGETLLTTPADDPETFEKGMHVILGETDRLSSMVEELLDFSRMESGRMTMVKTRMDILAELEEAVLTYQARAKREEKTLTYSAPEMLPYVFGDRNRLRQVFINIIDNAMKYTDGGDTICITAMEQEGMVQVRVSDTGLGIAEEDLPYITQKFYKANKSRRGSGIGLAVASEIVYLHDGELTIESVYGEGTAVTITLPAVERE